MERPESCKDFFDVIQDRNSAGNPLSEKKWDDTSLRSWKLTSNAMKKLLYTALSSLKISSRIFSNDEVKLNDFGLASETQEEPIDSFRGKNCSIGEIGFKWSQLNITKINHAFKQLRSHTETSLVKRSCRKMTLNFSKQASLFLLILSLLILIILILPPLTLHIVPVKSYFASRHVTASQWEEMEARNTGSGQSLYKFM